MPWRSGQDALTADQRRDYFDLLCALLEDYDREHVRWPKVRVRARLQHLLDESGLSAAGLSRLLGGSRNLGAMILRGDRNLTPPTSRSAPTCSSERRASIGTLYSPTPLHHHRNERPRTHRPAARRA